MSPRLPFLVLLGVFGGGVLASPDPSSRPVVQRQPDVIPGLAAPAASSGRARTSTWYCAGGTADVGGIADHTVVVSNPTDAQVTGSLTLHLGRMAPPVGTTAAVDGPIAASPTAPQAFAVSAHDQKEFRLADLFPAPLAAALVEIDGGGVAVEHVVRGPTGWDVSPCASRASSTWHFAWGTTTRDARETLVLFNPFASAVTVDASFATEAGVREPVRWRGLTVPARSVIGVEVGDDVTRRERVAVTLRARGGRLIVDRLQSLDGSTGQTGLSVALGQPAAAESWLFAHGGIDDQTREQVLLYNPGRETAELQVSVRDGQASVRSAQPFEVVVRPSQVEVLEYAELSRIRPGVQHSTLIASRNGVPIVAERVLRTSGAAGSAASLSAGSGALVLADTWTFPMGWGRDDADARFAVVNPDPAQPARVSLSLHRGGTQTAPPELQNVEVPASGRVELVIPAASGSVAGVVVHATSPVMVERMVLVDGRPAALDPGLPAGNRITSLPPLASP